MKIRNISPLGDIEVEQPPVFRRTIKAGDIIDLPDELATQLLKQSANFQIVDKELATVSEGANK